MHLLDLYATSSGSKIDKPFIYESFFPLPNQPYITFQAQTKFDSKDYSYWQEVINVMYPILTKLGYQIVQVGLANERPYQYVIDYRGKTNVNQLAYVIRNAVLHFGSDSFGVHLASGHDIPIVALYSIIQSAVAGPRFGSKDKQILFESFTRLGNKKPSYAQSENPKSVNLIKPEEIANAILKLLEANFQIPIETVYIGKQYNFDKMRDFIPNQVVGLSDPESPIVIRMDIEFNEQVLVQQLMVGKGVIITDKPINLNLIRQSKKRIQEIIYDIKETDHPEFVSEAKRLGVPLALISSLSPEKLNPKKINYYEIGKINLIQRETPEKIEELQKDAGKLYYRSNKIILSKNKFYLSDAARIRDIEIKDDFEFQKVIDTPEFWNELNYMHIIKRT